ncbi:hypothetical protein ACHAXH_000904 [Discostella pseudostelligera]
MMNINNRMIIKAIILSFGLVQASAAAEGGVHDVVAASSTATSRGRRLTRHLRLRKKAHSKVAVKDSNLMNDEDVAFWTRHLVGSIPIEQARPTLSPTFVGSVETVGPSSSPPVLMTSAPTIGAIIESIAPTAGAVIETIAPTVVAIETIAPTVGAVIETIAPTVGIETIAPTAGVVETSSPTNTCGITPSEREFQIKDNLSVISFPELFDQTGTPQAQALNWIITDDAAQLCPEDASLVQRYTLALFYFAMNGDNWNECSAPAEYDPASIDLANIACNLTTTNATDLFPTDISGTNAWLSPDSECTWGGVSCYAENTANSFKVNVIEMESNGLSGTLPEEMQELTAIRFLALERGEISGTIPNSFGTLQSLLLLDLDYNELTGTLPDTLWTLASLRQLDLNNNNFVGPLSEDIGLLTELRFIQVDNNDLTGTIPSSLGEIPNISLIGLSGNAFVGAAPSEVCALRPSPLQTFVVSCDIECEIPECCTSCVP